MIQIKKTILTLVALLAVTTGAWAEDLYEEFTTNTSASFYTGEHFKITPDYPGDGDGFALSQAAANNATIEALNGEIITKVEFTKGYYDITRFFCEVGTTTFSGNVATVSGVNQTSLTVTATNPLQIKAVKVYYTDAPPVPAGPEVDWNKTSKTGTFTMLGGNVELEPEYYPQAVLSVAPTPADGAKATTDDLLVSGGTVATITGSDPAAPQGTLMYYVSTTTMSTEALLALDADKWVAEPTAAGITQKCGAFVYYYVKGNESTDDALNFSDGDISSDNVLNVPIFPAPTYAVTFADGIDEPTLWTADPNTDVTKGQTVTVTYTGSKKVLGVKAEKKAAAATLQTVNITGDTSATLYFLPGETFGQAIANHPENTSFEINGGYITCNGYWLCIGYYDGDVTPDTLVEANGDYRGLLM